MHPVLRAQEEAAAGVLPADVADYYAGGSGEEETLAGNRAAWHDFALRPSVLRDVSAVDTTVTLLGATLAAPILVAPTALHGLAHPDGEAATAAGAAAAGSLLVLSARSSVPVEHVAPAGRWWFQAYAMRDAGLSDALIERAVRAGASALVLTGDTPYVGIKARPTPGVDPNALHLANLASGPGPAPRSPESVRQDPSITEASIRRLGERHGLPVLVKGVLRADDAERCVAAGAAGLIVSNHGGRQLDRAVPTAHALAEVVAAAGGVPVLVDGGIRSGTDVLVALGLGAAAVLVGRPIVWALAADGADGVERCLRALQEDLGHVLALAGATSPGDLPPGLVTPRWSPRG
jgi:4-hydroxymandelate oxidase